MRNNKIINGAKVQFCITLIKNEFLIMNKDILIVDDETRLNINLIAEFTRRRF